MQHIIKSVMSFTTINALNVQNAKQLLAIAVFLEQIGL